MSDDLTHSGKKGMKWKDKKGPTLEELAKTHTSKFDQKHNKNQTNQPNSKDHLSVQGKKHGAANIKNKIAKADMKIPANDPRLIPLQKKGLNVVQNLLGVIGTSLITLARWRA